MIKGEKTSYYSYGNIFKSEAEVFYPSSVEELKQILQFCKENNRRITPAGSFNSFDKQNASNDIVISLSRFNSIHYNKSDHTITVGAGAMWTDILEIAYQNKSVPYTCITGKHPTAGGTLSAHTNSTWTPSAGKEGNHCLEFEILTTQGELLRCSRSENSDLFFGAISGLGMLGFIVKIKYQLLYIGYDFEIEIKPTDYADIEAIEQRLDLRKTKSIDNVADLKSQSTLFYIDKQKPKFTVFNRTYVKIPKRKKDSKFYFYLASLSSGIIRFFPALANQVLVKDIGIPSTKRKVLQGINSIQNGTFWAEPDYNWSKYISRPFGLIGYKAKLYQNSYFIPNEGSKTTLFTKEVVNLMQKYKLHFYMFDVMYIPKDEPFVLSSSRYTDGFYVNTTFMDKINEKDLMDFYAELNDLAYSMGGKMNLVKNCFIKPELLEKMHATEIQELVALKQKYDPANLLTSKFFEDYFPSFFPKQKQPEKHFPIANH